jgi:DNA-binding cell septation regulator SpoVG
MPRGRSQRTDTPDAGPEAPEISARETAVAEAPAGQQDEQRNPIPLQVRITSLEMDGSTRAFAAAEYGDLTISRIRVKQDESGALAVAMPRYRQGPGWKETCHFKTAAARTRLTGAVLDAYARQIALLQGQTEAGAREQYAGPEECPELESPEQSPPGLCLSMNMSR